MERINEFNDKINEKELISFSKRIRKLSPEKIDELWYLCDFIIKNHKKDLKAFRSVDLDNINESLISAKEVVWGLIAETPIEKFKKNLSKVEE